MSKLTPVELQQSLDGLLQTAGVSLAASPQPLTPSLMPPLAPPLIPPLALVVGLSGGVDSVVLLHALSCLDFSKSYFKLKAIHINHQLQSQANDWQSFCVSFCEKLNIPIECISVDASSKQGKGPEAAARNARYAAFKKIIQTDDILLTAHHLDDQIETVFLQILRGTGVDGAAGIRPVSKFNSSYLMRPLLMFNREAIEAYATKNNLSWINDPSNNETHYDRNYLRHEVLPVIEKRWASYRDTICRFSQNMRQASELLSQIAEQDLFDVAKKSTRQKSGQEKRYLEIEKLNKLSLPRKNNLIRFWLISEGYAVPSVSQIKQIHAAIIAREDSNPIVSWADVELRRFQNNLYLVDKKQEKIPDNFSINISNWKQGESIKIPGYGSLELLSSKSDGIKASYFSSGNIQIKLREGGERCKPQSRNKTQTLKKIFQENNIPPWRRDSVPIVLIDGEIAAVVEEFYCSPFAVEKDVLEAEAGLKIVRVIE